MPLDTEDISFGPRSLARQGIARVCIGDPLLLDDGLCYIVERIQDLVEEIEALKRGLPMQGGVKG